MSVFTQGRASMHFRLGDAPDVQLVVIGVLRTLLSHLQKWPELLSHHEPGGSPEPNEAKERLDESPRGRCLRGMADEISMLFTVSNIIRRGSRQSQNVKADEENKETDGPLYQRLLWHVHKHFPAPHSDRPAEGLAAEEQFTQKSWEAISSRLASTMLIRHRRVLYRKSRYERAPTRMRQTVQHPKINIPAPAQEDELVSEPAAIKTRPDLEIPADHDGPKAHSVISLHTATTLTQRRYNKAATPSVISTRQTGPSTRRDALEFPQRPVHCVNEKYQSVVDDRWPLFRQNLEEILKTDDGNTSVLVERVTAAVDELDRSLGKEFLACVRGVAELTCPICFCALPGEVLSNRSKWESHVLGDLDAYVCLFQDCDVPKELYARRAGWISHMREHTRRWSCVTKSHGKQDFTTRDEYINHVTAEHSGTYTAKRLQLLADRSSWIQERLFDSCPLCGGDSEAAKTEEHVATHLRMLALISLPHQKRYDEDHPHHDSKSYNTDSSALSTTPTIAEDTPGEGGPEAQAAPAREMSDGIMGDSQDTASGGTTTKPDHETIALATEDNREPPVDELAEQQLRAGISFSPWQGMFPPLSEPSLDEDPNLKSLREQQSAASRAPVSICTTKEVRKTLRKLQKLVGKERRNSVKEILGAIPAARSSLPEKEGQDTTPTVSLSRPISGRPPHRGDFRIAIVCSSPLEFDAVSLLFTEMYDSAELGQASGNDNTCVTGRLGGHDVVLVVAPLRERITSFPNVGLALLVGICGAPPQVQEKDVLAQSHEDDDDDSGVRDIFLGDVVVGTSVTNSDLGIPYTGGWGDDLERANKDIHGLVAHFKGRHNLESLRSEAVRNLRCLHLASAREGLWVNYGPPPDDTDKAFPAKYAHTHRKTVCSACEAKRFCPGVSNMTCEEAGCRRPMRSRKKQRPVSAFPNIIMGKVACGNATIQSALHRDHIARTSHAIAFGYGEASGWDNVPCILIKGVCDYADNHNNKTWRKFAAATAASVAVAILHYYDIAVDEMARKVTCTEGEHPVSHEEATDQTLIDRLYFDEFDEGVATLATAHPGTCDWALASRQYRYWHQNGDFLWIKGPDGAGKSTLMKFLAGEPGPSLRKDVPRITLSFFFRAKGAMLEQSMRGLYRSLLHQLLKKAPELKNSLDWLTPNGRKLIKRAGWGDEKLKTTLTRAMRDLGAREITICVDALDECDAVQAAEIVRFFHALCSNAQTAKSKLHICFSSSYGLELNIQRRLEVLDLDDEPGHSGAIKSYAEWRLQGGDPDKTDILSDAIAKRSLRNFLWADLAIGLILDEYRIAASSTDKILERLSEMPLRLNPLYRMILTRDGDADNAQRLRACLMWLLFAARPLNQQELYFGVQQAVDPDRSGNSHEYFRIRRDFVRRASNRLAKVTETGEPKVQLIHSSVTAFLLNKNLSGTWFGAADNLEGRSHQLISEVCQLTLDIAHRRSDLAMEMISDDDDFEELARSFSQFPLLEYAATNILFHANSAQQAGMDQSGLIKSFPLEQLRLMFNISQRSKTLRYTRGVNSLYILAERNRAALIRIHPQRHTGFDVGSERCGAPILAAVANGSGDAIRELLRAQEERLPDSSPLRGLHREYNPSLEGAIKWNFMFDQAEYGAPTVLLHLARHGDAILFRFALAVVSENEPPVDLEAPLASAAAAGHGHIVELLLETGRVDVNSTFADKRTPLSIAAEAGYKDVVRALLITGEADLELADNSGRTPLDWAVTRRHKAVIGMLRKASTATKGSKGKARETALD
ncbi:hypothetical protein RB599_003983 [Gaeumannomyces hyphopodioides]